MTHIFISHTRSDRDWAEWIALTLKEVGYSVEIQSWSSPAGTDWVDWMNRAVPESDTLVAVLSDQYMDSPYAMVELYMAFTDDPTAQKRKIIPVRVRECEPRGLLARLSYADLVGVSEKVARDRLFDALQPDTHTTLRPLFPNSNKFPASSPSDAEARGSSPPRVGVYFSESWPVTDPFLVGRESEMRLLDRWWRTPSVHVVSLVAWGGAGKTALLNRWWIRLMQRANWRGAERVFAWSFYNQGAEEGQQSSADQFIGEALRWFGDVATAESSLTPWAKGVRLAEFVSAQRTLLLLDGLEPLQEPTGGAVWRQGSIKDAALRGLLLTLAKGNSGLCVLTTRLRVNDLRLFEDTSVRSLDLERLADEDGAHYLEHLGVAGPRKQIVQAAKEFGGHPLALTLLGKYLVLVHSGDIRQRAADLPLISTAAGASHAKRVMQCYERWFKDQPELDVLYMLSLFDRPAEPDAIRVFRNGPVIRGLTGRLKRLSLVEWVSALDNLASVRLLSAGGGDTALDTHPLVREHFGERLRAENVTAWRAAHSRLFKYFSSPPRAKDAPETLKDLEPLYRAVAHGCKAGQYRKALKLYAERILRGSQYYSWKKYGNFGMELDALSKFFDRVWDVPTKNLVPKDRGYVLNEAGFHRMALGRMREALGPARAAFTLFNAQKDYDNVAVSCSNLSKLYSDLGELEESHTIAGGCVALVKDKSGWYPLVGLMVAHAAALHQLGSLNEAHELFAEAENIHSLNSPEYPFLYAFRGFRYCELLLERGDAEAVRLRASQTLFAVESRALMKLPSYSIGLSHLLMGEALLFLYGDGRDECVRAEQHVESAVELLRQASQQRHIACALLVRTRLHLMSGRLEGAQQDLEEVLELTSRSDMRRLECDTHLEYCRLLLATAEGCNATVEDLTRARWHLERARQMAEEMRYRRRDCDLALISARLHFCAGRTDAAQAELRRAEGLLEELGRHRNETEVCELHSRFGGT
jgi:tetratricopeptide (TPR) repeat protein